MRPNPIIVCATCGFHGAHKSEKRGSVGLGVLLLLCYIIPGLLYFAWRSTTEHRVCPACGGTNVIPDDTPVARRIIGEADEMYTRPAPRGPIGADDLVCDDCGEVYDRVQPKCPRCRSRSVRGAAS